MQVQLPQDYETPERHNHVSLIFLKMNMKEIEHIVCIVMHSVIHNIPIVYNT